MFLVGFNSFQLFLSYKFILSLLFRSAIVNATGKKTLVQQVFHPSLFSRTRSVSLGSNSLPVTDSTETPSQQSTETPSTQPPHWQRVPTARNHKRKKVSQSPSPEVVKTTNRFIGLPIDLTDCDNDEPTIKRPVKPPPIILYGIDDVTKLTNLL